MGTSIPVSSLITCVRTSDRNWPTDMPRAEAASSSVYSAFPETHSTIPVTPSPSLTELLSILGFRGDLTHRAEYLFGMPCCLTLTWYFSRPKTSRIRGSGEQSLPDGHHQSMRYHRSANSSCF